MIETLTYMLFLNI